MCLAVDTGRPIAHVAAEIGVVEQLLGRWVAVAKARAATDNPEVLDDDERAELEWLRRENAELRLDRAFLKKQRLLRLRTEPVAMYRVVEAEKANFTVTRMTRLPEVSRSGFYKWRATQAAGPTPAQQRRAAIDAKVKAFHDASDQVYGAPRILADLREDGEVVSRKTVAAAMRAVLSEQVIFGADRGTPPGSSPGVPAATSSPNQSAGRGCAGTTTRTNHSGAH